MSGPVSVRRNFDAFLANRPRVVWLAAIALLVLHYALAVGGKFQESMTSDEIVHLTAGVSYWQNHDYRLHPENGILPQRWAALPAWLGGAKFPELVDNPYWRSSHAWVLGRQFCYETGEDHFPRLMAGRAMIGLFSVATGLLVFCWARRLYGDAAGLVALVFFVFCTDFLAHGALVTSDACAVFFLLAATGAWWRHLHDGRARAWWLSAGLLGLAFVAKYSAVLLLPMMVAMAVVRALAPAPLHFAGRTFATRAGRLGAAALSLAGHAAVVVLTIWLFYGFRFSAFNPALPPAEQFIRPWAFMEERTGAAGALVQAVTAAHLLPEAFLYGFIYVVHTVTERSAFLNGEYSLTGWPSFFVWTFFLKTTLPVIIAVGLTGWLALRRWARGGPWARDLYPLTPLAVFFVVYWLSSVTSHLNIGHRHILPTYPVLFIGLGALGEWALRVSRARLALVGLLLGWHVAAAAQVAPHYLAYFNPLAGGPGNGWRHLVDSSLDWGQDLPGLKRWLDRHPDGKPVYLSYFGTGSPDYYRIDARRLPFANNFLLPVTYVDLEAGTYCVGATMLQQVYSPVRGATWTLALEQEYQGLRALEPAFGQYARDPLQRAVLLREAPAASWDRGIARHQALRFARLCHFLRVRPPDAQVGYSIFIHRLTAEEVAAATAGSLPVWAGLIERTAAARP